MLLFLAGLVTGTALGLILAALLRANDDDQWSTGRPA